MVVNHNFISQAKDKENYFNIKQHNQSAMNTNNKSMHNISTNNSVNREKWKIKKL